MSSPLSNWIAQLSLDFDNEEIEHTKKALCGLMWRVDPDSSCPPERRLTHTECLDMMEYLGLHIPQWIKDRGNGPVTHSGRAKWARREKDKQERVEWELQGLSQTEINRKIREKRGAKAEQEVEEFIRVRDTILVWNEGY